MKPIVGVLASKNDEKTFSCILMLNIYSRGVRVYLCKLGVHTMQMRVCVYRRVGCIPTPVFQGMYSPSFFLFIHLHFLCASF